MGTPTFITSATVAAMIGATDAAAFLRQRPRLEDETLFPRPMPTSQRPLRWRADEVQAWVARQGVPAAPEIDPADIATGRIVLMQLARTA